MSRRLTTWWMPATGAEPAHGNHGGQRGCVGGFHTIELGSGTYTLSRTGADDTNAGGDLD
ncbi:MAG: hypothetical protein R3C05_00715 [Pirellulaceae bacterium]